MATLTYAQKQAFCETVAQFIRENHSDLRKAGFDPSKLLSELEKNLENSVQLDVEQETLKAQLVKTTDEAVNAIRATYKQASSLIDVLAGVYGKGSPMVRSARESMRTDSIALQRRLQILLYMLVRNHPFVLSLGG
jgi:hypothetical protein